MGDTVLALRKMCRVLWDIVPYVDYLNGASEREGLCWGPGWGTQTDVKQLTWQLRVHLSLESSSLMHCFHPFLLAFLAALLIYAEGVFPALPPSSWWAFPIVVGVVHCG